jgi:hypothetical protein
MIPIPERMKHLEKDHRGYPIPWIVLRDNDNKPHFTINDTIKVMRCREEDLCSICGIKLLRGRWFIGGPLSALHPHGAYIDPPLHHECMAFAAQVCPYIASPKYSGRIDAKTINPAKAKGIIGFLDQTMIPERPDIFVAVMAISQTVTENGYLVPKRPYRKMEIWRDGKMIRDFTAEQILNDWPKRLWIEDLLSTPAIRIIP